MTPSGLALLAAISIAIEPSSSSDLASSAPRMAVVTATGLVVVSSPDGAALLPVHQCPIAADDSTDPLVETSSEHAAAPPCGPRGLPAAIAWHDHALYVACAASTLSAWHPGQVASQPVASVPATQIAALGTGASGRLLVADIHARVWTSTPTGGFEPIMTAPQGAGASRPVLAIAELDGAIVVATASAVWWLQDDVVWRPVAGATACALATAPATRTHPARLWLAGPAGILELAPAPDSTGARASASAAILVRSLAPATGVSHVRGHIFVADGQRVRRLSVDSGDIAAVVWAGLAGATSALPGDAAGSDVSGLARAMAAQRRRRARWLPALGAGIVYHEGRAAGPAASRQHGIELWLWLAWDLSGEALP